MLKSLIKKKCLTKKHQHVDNKNYVHAKEVWNKFKISAIGDYHDMYIKTDVLSLAALFEQFKKICLQYYKLDPFHYFSSRWILN